MLPLAITYGMSANEFWEGNPDLFWAYRFSYYTRMKEEQEAMNYKLWLQGAYFYEAISVALANSFGKGKKQSYSSKPYVLTKEEEEREKKKKSKELETQIKNRIMQMQSIIGQKDEALPKGKEGGGKSE